MGIIRHISKKTIAVIVAVVLVLCSISIIAFALPDDPVVNATVRTKWLVYDSEAGDYVDALSGNAEYARPGDSVRADIYFTADTPVDNISLLYSFDEDLLENDWSKYNQSGTEYEAVCYNGFAGFVASGTSAYSNIIRENRPVDPDNPEAWEVPEDFFDGYGGVSVAIYTGNYVSYNDTLITSIFFTVKSTDTVKPDSDGAVLEILDRTYCYADLCDKGFVSSYIISIEDPYEPGENLDSPFLNLTVLSDSQQLLFGGDVNFDAVNGFGTIGTGTVATSHGYYESTLKSTDIPEVTPEDGYVLIGWSSSRATSAQTDGEGNTVLGGKYSDMVIDCDNIQDEYADIIFKAPENADTLYAVYAYAPADYTVNIYTQKLDDDGQPVDEYELYGDSHELSGRVADEITLSDLNAGWLPDENGFELASTDPDESLVLSTDEESNVFSVYYDRKSYTITWKISADDETAVDTATVYYGADAGTAFYADPDVPAFLDDADSDRFGSKVTGWSDHEFACADDILVTAQLSPVDVIVKYHDTDAAGNKGAFASGNEVFEANKKYGDSIGSADFTDTLTPPTGYHFADNAAVYKNSAGVSTEATDLGAIPGTLDKSNYYCLDTQNEAIIIDVYPKFEIDTGDITFDANGGSFADGTLRVDSYEYGQTVYVPVESDFTVLKSETDESGVTSYYTLKGWGTASDSTETVSVDSTFVTDKTYYAVWEDNRITVTFIGKNDETVYTLRRNLDNGSYILDENDYPASSAVPVVEGEQWVWEVEPGTEITSDIVITGYSEYEFEYCWKDSNNIDNSTNAVYLTEGTNLPANPVPEAAGYEFKGWYSDSGYNTVFCAPGDEADCQMPASPLTLYGYYEAIEYTVTYYAEENDTEAYETYSPVYYNQDIPAPVQPVKDGYTFRGWTYYSLDADSNVTGVYTGEKMPANSLKAVAIWTVNTFTIDFDSNGGSEVEDITAAYEASITWPDAPELEGYSFVNWHVDTVNGAVYSDRPTAMPLIGDENDATLKLVAEWSVNAYNVTYNLNDGGTGEAAFENNDDHPNAVNYNETIPAPAVARDGYTFTGWTVTYTDGNNAQQTLTAGESSMPAYAVSYEANWVLNPTVTFYEDADAKTAEEVYYSFVIPYGDTLTEDMLPDAPEREGYSFDGWPTDLIGVQITEDKEITGSFTRNSYTLYTIVPKDSTQNTSVPVLYGEALAENMPGDPVVEKYQFNGWIYYTDESCGDEYLYEGTTMPAGDLYAVADLERIGAVYKLMPVVTDNGDGTTTPSTAMIERNKVVETYNAGILDGTDRLPTRNQLTAREADDEYYEYPQYAENSADYDSWFLYGLKPGLSKAALANYVTVSNGGHYVIEGAYRDRTIATGTVIKVYDKDGNFVEQFRVVIYGDIDGNGTITGTDAQKADKEVVTPTFSTRQGQAETPYLFRASDLDQNGNFTGTDDQRFNEAIPGIRVISQITGRAETKS